MSDFKRYADTIRTAAIPVSAKDYPSALHIASDGDLAVYYAPFDYVNAKARICICGITPGFQQAVLALNQAKKSLLSGSKYDEALRSAKETASFGGPMRSNLVAMLDFIGIPRLLGIESGAQLFGARADVIHYTSALRYPVFLKSENYSGTPNMISRPFLRKQIEQYLAQEISLLPEECLYVPLGPKVSEAFAHLSQKGILSLERVLDGLPHPSGANAERINYFLGKKERASLSHKTNALQIDAARAEILRKVSAVRA